MNAKTHILITGQSNSVTWSKRIPVTAVTAIRQINNITLMLLERHYWLETKTNKVRYQANNCSNASYQHLYIAYVEIANGVYAQCGTFSDTDLETRILQMAERVANRFDPNRIANYLDQIVPY